MTAVLLLSALSVVAQEPPPDDTTQGSVDRQGRQVITDVLVVTASGSEQRLHEAAASISVLDTERIEALPAADFGDLLRNVPGLNVVQLSAGDTQVVGRQAATSVATSELVLVDGRTVYLDFFGFVLWSFVPVDPHEIRQIEVVRGPGSAVWGANALSGVINLITKPPREMLGTSVALGAGNLGILMGSFAHAGISEPWSWKVSGGYYEQDPFPRPRGLIPGTSTPYPPFDNAGTRQPRIHVRLDREGGSGTSWSLSSGYAGADGILHTGIGPFRIPSGSGLSFLKVDRVDDDRRISFFANLLDGKGQNLLTTDADGNPVSFDVESQTYDLSYADTRALGQRHILTWGGSLRRNDFDLTIAPAGEDRNEVGVFFQDEILLGEVFRWTIGARWDDIDTIDAVVSPRTSLGIALSPAQTLRLSYNRAFRAPSLLNNFMDTTILTRVILPASPPLLPEPVLLAFPSRAVGDPQLSEERLEAFEVGFIANLGTHGVLSLALYRNEIEDSIDFFPATFYDSSQPPPGFPLPPFVLDLPPLAGALPSSFSFRNVGRVVDQGFEAALELWPAPRWSLFMNYSFQDEPEARGIPESELNQPPEHRANLGVDFRGDKLLVGASFHYVDDAFWTDVLDSRFWGPTDDYTLVNLRVGVPVRKDTLHLTLNIENLLDEHVQQHVFGDVLERKAWLEARFRF